MKCILAHFFCFISLYDLFSAVNLSVLLILLLLPLAFSLVVVFISAAPPFLAPADVFCWRGVGGAMCGLDIEWLHLSYAAGV